MNQFDNTLNVHVEKFLTYLRVECNSSGNTVLAYMRDLSKVMEFCKRKGIAEWSDLKMDHVRQLVASESRKKQKAASINRLLCAVRSLYKYLVNKLHVCSENPAVGIAGPRGAQRLPKVLEVDETAQLLDAEVADTFLGRRDQAILELFYSSALRLSELVDLELGQLDLLDGLVRVVGKGSKERIVPVGRKAREALALYLQHRRLLDCKVDNVFVTHHGGKLTPRAVQKRVKEAGQRSLGRHLHPHILRHSCATHVLQSSHDLRAVQEILGHADISTTQIYTHLDLGHLQQTIHTAHPRGKRVS